MVQNHAAGLCDAIFRALPLVGRDEPVLLGLPDTVWFPVDALRALPDDRLSFLLFPVRQPELFDAVLLDGDRVTAIEVKAAAPRSHWMWGAFKLPGAVLHDLHALWLARERQDLFIGTLVNAYLARAGRTASRRGELRGRGHAARLSRGDARAGRPGAAAAGARARCGHLRRRTIKPWG